MTARLDEARPFGHSVPAQALFEFAADGRPNVIHTGGMDLPERRRREVFRAKLPQEEFPVFPTP